MRIKRKDTAKIPEGELVRLFRETGRSEYSGELLLRYVPMIYGIGLTYTPEGQATKAFVREFCKLIPEKMRTDAKEPVDFSKWVYAAALDFFGKKYPAAAAAMSEKKQEQLSAKAAALMEKIIAGDAQSLAQMENNSVHLTRSQKECIRLFLTKGMAFADIADSAGYLEVNIRRYIVAGLNILASPPAAKHKDKTIRGVSPGERVREKAKKTEAPGDGGKSPKAVRKRDEITVRPLLPKIGDPEPVKNAVGKNEEQEIKPVKRRTIKVGAE